MLRLLIALALSGSTALAQLPERWFDDGDVGRAYGRSIAVVDDLDADGVDDYAIAAPTNFLAPVDGSVRIVSSLAGSLLGEIQVPVPSTHPFQGFGGRVAVVNDHDADGRRDIAIWQGDSIRGFFSSVSHALLKDFNGSAFTDIREVVPLEDMNGDGVGEYAWHRALTPNIAALEVLDGATDTVLAATSLNGIPGPLVSVPDLDGDGYRDLARSIPSGSISSTGTSTLQLTSSATAAIINTLTASSAFARQIITGDFNGDLVDDLAVATTFGSPIIEIMDGSTLAALTVIASVTGPSAIGVGEFMTAADVEGRGADDLIYNEGSVVKRFSLTTGTGPPDQLFTLALGSTSFTDVFAIASVRDRDGLDDVIAGYSTPGVDTGAVRGFGFHGGRRYGARSGPPPQPRLSWNSYLTADHGGRLQLTMATPNGAGFGLASFATGSLMTFGIEVLVNTAPLFGFQIEDIVFDAQGEWSLELSLSQPVIAGQSLFVQVVDPNGALRSTEGVELFFLP